MARIVYSLSGEGRGHATRSETVISMLQNKHSVLVYAPPLAHEILKERLAGRPSVTLCRLDGLRFQYRNERLSYPLSIASAIPFLCGLKRRMAVIEREVRDWQATHVLNDFEPLLARVAKRIGLPLLSLDHQHFLSAIDTRLLPHSLAWKVRLLRQSIPLFCPQPDHQIISSYFDFPLRSVACASKKVGVLLRKPIQQARIEDDEHLVVYVRHDFPERLQVSLRQADRPVFVYGLGAKPSCGNLNFMETCTDGFLENLRRCAALVCSSGNQLIGEALYLGKPILAVPESGNFEQEINGHFLPLTGGGVTVRLNKVEPRTVRDFLDQLPFYRQMVGKSQGGNIQVQRILDELIDGTVADSESVGSCGVRSQGVVINAA
jgi:uncharacterized protein (TIGR00661 family)